MSNRGREYPSERKFFTDPETGVRITKLTAFPLTHHKLYFHINQFTPDSQTLVFACLRESSRAASEDIYKVNTDGMGLVQLTDDPDLSGAILSYDGRFLYYLSNGTLKRVDIHSFEEQEINHIDGLKTAGCTSLTYDGKYLCGEGDTEDGGRMVYLFATDGSKKEIICRSDMITHTQIEPSEGKVIAFQHGPDQLHRNIWLVDIDGSNMRPLELPYGNGHWMWIGSSKRIMTNLESSCWGISTFAEGDAQVEKIVSDGLTCWHGSCSMDGQWMVTDTNWPDQGIHVINIASKKHMKLCSSNSSNCHPQWTHPHPSFSPDVRYVAFNSDQTGISHIYLAEVPAELKAALV